MARTFVVKRSDVERCPKRSLLPSHYNDDGTCRCEHARGWWNMPCWNGLSDEQQTRLVHVGNLPLGYQPEGTCKRGARVAIETEHDFAPGPRFYCVPCALEYLRGPDLRTW